MVTFWCVFDFSQSNITFQISWVSYRPALQNFLCKEISRFYVFPPPPPRVSFEFWFETKSAVILHCLGFLCYFIEMF